VAVLRHATRAHHDRIDRLMDLPRMGERAHYGRVLQVLAEFLSAWEPAVSAALPGPWRPWLQARSRRPFLQHDLHRLHLSTPAPATLPPFARDAAWGSVYVMEGSALGGQFIVRRLAEAGLHPGSGAAYFHGWGVATAGLWRETRGVLATQLADPAALAQACEGARSTFDTLSRLLENTVHERTAAA
jgi:heme oxygenase